MFAFYFLLLFSMHFLTYVFIASGADPESAVAKALHPFDEALEVAPYPIYLSDDEVAAMAKFFRLRRKQVRHLSEKMPEWRGCPGGVDERGLFSVATHNPEGKWDWYEIGGRWDGFLPGNVMAAQQLVKSKRLSQILPNEFLDGHGVWHSRDRWVQEPYPFGRIIEMPKRRWSQRLEKSLRAHPQCDIVVVDIHR
jgi:hypothetical protein